MKKLNKASLAGDSTADNTVSDSFRRVAHVVSLLVGSPWAFILSMSIIIAWALVGPLFGFSDTWQLIINTGTTIITFLMVFLIQNTQNRDARVIHLKLDEIIRSIPMARNHLIDLEVLSDKELDKLQDEFCALHEHTQEKLAAIREIKKSKKQTRS